MSKLINLVKYMLESIGIRKLWIPVIFCIKFKTVLDYTVTVRFRIYAGVLKKEFFHKKSCRKDDIVC